MGRSTRTRAVSRRLFVAITIGLLVGSVAGTTFAGSGSEADGSAFRIPLANVGDRAAYAVTLAGDWLLDEDHKGEAFPRLAFEWRSPEFLRDEHGIGRKLDAVRVQGDHYVPATTMEVDGNVAQGPSWIFKERTFWLEPGTTSVAAMGGDTEVTTATPIADAPNQVPVPRNSVRQVSVVRQYVDAVPVAHCLAGDELQGRTLVVGASFHLPACVLENLAHVRPAGRFIATSTERVGGIDAMRLEGGNVTMWWAQGLPFPIRYETTQPISVDHEGHVGIGFLAVELSGFERGQTPRGPASTTLSHPTIVATATRLPWGMDDTGIEHPFPLSVAFAAAKEKSVSFAALLARSPHAYLATALENSLGPSEKPGSTWWMTLTDGTDAVQVVVGRQTSGAPDPTRGLAPSAALPGGSAATVTLHAENTMSGTRFPIPNAVPQYWPTVAGLAERWHAYTGDAGHDWPVTGWGHVIECAGDACSAPRFSTGVGHRSSQVEAMALDPTNAENPLDLEPRTALQSILWINATSHRALAFIDASSDRRYETLLAPSQLSPADASDRGAGRAGALRAFWSTREAVGVGALALVSVLLYWMWSAAKSGSPVGLFSRLHQDHVLDHPHRARLVEAIRANPGVHFSELLRRTGIPNGSLHHHLQVLKKAGTVELVAKQGYTCYFLPGVAVGNRLGAAAAKAEGAQRILAQVQARPGLSLQQVAQQCELRPSTVSYHVHRLGDAGLVQAVRDGRSVRLWANAAIEANA